MLLRLIKIAIAIADVADLVRSVSKKLKSKEDPLRRAELEVIARMLNLYRVLIEDEGNKWRNTVRQIAVVAHEVALFSRNKKVVDSARNLESVLSKTKSKKRAVEEIERFVELLKSEL